MSHYLYQALHLGSWSLNMGIGSWMAECGVDLSDPASHDAFMEGLSEGHQDGAFV